MHKTNELNLSYIINLIIKKIKLISLFMLLGAMISFAYFYFFVSPKYVSSTSLYVNNKENQSSNALNINDITASQKLVNTYIVILKNDEVLNKVSARLMQEYTNQQLDEYIGLSDINGKKVIKTDTLRNVLTMSSVDNTEVLKIQAQTKNAEFSARLCTIISDVAPEVLQRIVKAGSVEVIGEPVIEYEKASPNIKINTILGAILGLAIAIAYAILNSILDRTIKGEEDLKTVIDVPILGEIPDFDNNKKRGQ